jgi:hypothetical protein
MVKDATAMIAHVSTGMAIFFNIPITFDRHQARLNNNPFSHKVR